MHRFFLSLVVLISLAACSRTPVSIPTAQPTAWPLVLSFDPLAESSDLTQNFRFQGYQLYLNDKVLLDWQLDELLPCGGAYVSFSPDNSRFLVIAECNEMANQMFLFKANGTHPRLISGAEESSYGTTFTWSPDSQSILYYRFTGYGSDAKPDLPIGVVMYHIPTGNKVFILPGEYWHFPDLPAWSSDGRWIVYLFKCRVIVGSSDGTSFWQVKNLATCSKTDRAIWEDTGGNVYRVVIADKASSNIQPLDTFVTSTGPADKTAIPVSVRELIDQ